MANSWESNIASLSSQVAYERCPIILLSWFLNQQFGILSSLLK